MLAKQPIASFDYFIQGKTLLIVDLDDDSYAPSVTNDIHNVVDYLKNTIDELETYTLIYRDSMGIYDLIQLKNNEPTFKSLGGMVGSAPIKNLDDALTAVIELQNKHHL